MTDAFVVPSLSELARPSGGFAMLAVDQREAMRAMFAETMPGPVSDEVVTDFKVAAGRILSPHASAVLVDRQFALDRFLDEGVVDPGCAVIAAGDHFVPSATELVADAVIDRQLDPASYRARGVKALKLLVIHRPGTDPAPRQHMVDEFVSLCRAADLLSIIEPVAKAPLDGGPWDWDAEVVLAARQLGNRGADLYKGEVPLKGRGSDAELLEACRRLGGEIASPWVVLSSGVDAEDFPRAVAIACRAGASGFLAGRAVWRSCVAPSGYEDCLRGTGAERLRRLADVVDAAMAAR
jgi:sulfofructosephosphate aldolase